MTQQTVDTRFAKFGPVSFASLTQVNDFIAYLEQGKLMGTRCKSCGRHFFPPRAHCFESPDTEMEWFEITGTGTLMSFSTLHYAPTGFTQDVPYTVALLDYGPVKVFGRVDGSVPLDQLHIGMGMKTVISRLPNNQLTYLFHQA